MAVSTRDSGGGLARDSRGNLILSEGMQDPAVAWLNQVFGWWGYTAGTSDTFDQTTGAAVRAFQARYGYAQTGVMDEDTWGLMDALARGAPAPPPPGQVAPATPAGAAPLGVTPVAPTAPTPASNLGQRDALARITGMLNQYGLGGLTDWVKGKLTGGASEAEITLELYDQPAFQARFPAIVARRNAGLTPVTVGQVLEYEQSGRELLRRSGITATNFTSSEYLQGLMTQDVSLAEVQDRLQDGLLKVTQAPPEVRVAFGNYFGTNSDAALAQLFLDPAQAAPELEKMAMTAFAGGVGARFGVQLAQGIAREIADTGASDSAIWQGFAQLDSIRALFDETISETVDMTAEGEGVSAVFGTHGGSDVIQRRALSRASTFKGGGGVGAGEGGVVGLGIADR